MPPHFQSAVTELWNGERNGGMQPARVSAGVDPGLRCCLFGRSLRASRGHDWRTPGAAGAEPAVPRQIADSGFYSPASMP